jgi:hypothetical protein
MNGERCPHGRALTLEPIGDGWLQPVASTCKLCTASGWKKCKYRPGPATTEADGGISDDDGAQKADPALDGF